MSVLGDFDSPSPGKPALVMEGWREAGIPLDVEEPEAATKDDLCLVHGRNHVEDILAGRALNGLGNCSAAIAESLPYTTGAMLAAARWAITNKSAAAAPCSGFHHAEWSRAMAFCTFNGLMMTARKLWLESVVQKVGILDCDYHYGNGTDEIIGRLEARSWMRHVTVGHGYERNATFLERLPALVEGFADCDVLLYQAGADPHVDDPLGGFLTTEELRRRDEVVFAGCRRLGLPVAWNLAGGYQDDLSKVVEIHVNTARAHGEVWG